MIYKLHDYQQYAINYILEHPIAAVILGRGLGKTSITLIAIEQLMYNSFEVRFWWWLRFEWQEIPGVMRFVSGNI